MRVFGHQRLLALALLGGAALLGLLWQSPAYGGGPLLVGGGAAGIGTAGQPFVWDTTSAISYHTDLGTLGTRTTAQANQLVREGFDVWQNVTTANIAFQQAAGDLGQDLTGASIMAFQTTFQNCQQSSQFTNAIIYDTDGTITDALLGAGESDFVLGFAGPVCINSATRFFRGFAVLNGLFIDGQPNPNDPTVNKYKEVFVHEFGHLIGLDHSQINVNVLSQLPQTRSDDDLFGLPLMFPFLLGNQPARVDKFGAANALAPDDKAWVSELYPSATFSTTYGAITGTILFSDGMTPLQGANVIARQVSDGDPLNGDESRRFAVSVVSGYLFTGNAGQNVTGTNTGGSLFGSRDPLLIGAYRIPLTLGDYTVEVEDIRPSFVDGSSVGPLGADAGEQFPLPGPPEFFNATESDTDDPAAFDPVPVTAPGTSVDFTDIILNGTPSRFDIYESDTAP